MDKLARTIAVIDDDLRVVESIVNLLASCGYRAEGYCSAEQFLGVEGLSKSSCIITDVEMREMSGLGLLHHVKSVNSPVPVVIITGKPSENSEAFYLERGAIGFFRKPIDGDALVDLLRSVAAISQTNLSHRKQLTTFAKSRRSRPDVARRDT